jgi:alpha-amylase/alpha-mannosidase (GH57 family)
MGCFACIHCHFYQPPRENPWLETVELQESASPYHDWNARIARECYLPNGASRILDSAGRISKIVNNYSRISFNFGPTLLSWMEQREPEGYQRILDGDRESQPLFSGHGGALAQAYNHVILPLANTRDKRTQILWGIKDFQHHFRRDPEGMWLPETAVDLETLDLLAAEGIKFTILAPRQAGQLRVQQDSPWLDLEYGIDSRQAYACELSSGRTIGLFFYDGALATAVAFEKLLYNGENFARQLLSRFDPDGDSAQLMHVATDGETYGHHHPHGDMALAYALKYIAENNLARITNYGEYFALHPPSQEIRIKERTSWSCAHGIGRWTDNCGCNAGADSRWNQAWRRPLRQAFDWLRDDLVSDYELSSKQLLKHPWSARDAYIEAVLDRSPVNVNQFLAEHAAHPLSEDEQIRALRLLELQRHLLLMYTSCGWFFDEPTGPETVQVLQYAARAVQLGEQLFGGDREEEFLKRLEQVRSNIPDFGNGREIYERFVRPAMLDLPGVAAHYAIAGFFDGYAEIGSIYSYEAELVRTDTTEHHGVKLATGAVVIDSRITRARLEFNFAVLHAGSHLLRAGVCESNQSFDHFTRQAYAALTDSGFDGCSQLLDSYFGRGIYSLKSLFCDQRQRIVSQIVNSKLSDLDKLYGEVYEENSALIEFLQELNMPLPPILRVSSEFVLKNAIRRALTSENADLEFVGVLMQIAKGKNISLDLSLKSAFCNRLDKMMKNWSQSPFNLELLLRLEAFVSLLRSAPFEVDLWQAQNAYYALSRSILPLAYLDLSETWIDCFSSLGQSLGIAVPEFSASYAGVNTVSDSNVPFMPEAHLELSASAE